MIKTDEVASYQKLHSYTDWNQLSYHLGGAPDFGEREDSGGQAGGDEGLGPTVLEKLAAIEWVDQTATTDLVFANGFELGSTTAWSETVP